jgi:hypothetical protein
MDTAVYDLLVRVQVQNILDEIIYDIQEWDSLNKQIDFQKLVAATSHRLQQELRSKLQLEKANQEV